MYNDSGEGEQAIQGILEGAKPGRTTSGHTTQYEKPGGVKEANSDFDTLPGKSVNIGNGKRRKNLPNGSKAIVYPESSKPNPHPSIDIQLPGGKNHIKIRYIKK